MKTLALTTAIAALTAGAAFADAEPYVMDPTHSTIKFSWSHGGFSTTIGIFVVRLVLLLLRLLALLLHQLHAPGL